MKISANGLSEMTLGTVQLGLRYGIANTLGKPDRGTACQMIQEAIRMGVNSLDTAQSYGDSEEVIGDCLRQYPGMRDGLAVTSKLVVQTPDGAPDNDFQREITGKAAESLKRLGIGQLRFFLLHQAADMYKSGGAVARAMEKLVASGAAAGAGVSVYTEKDIREMLRYPVFTAVQLPLSVFDQKLIDSGILPELERRGITVFVRSVFSQGLLFMEPERMTKPVLAEYMLPHLLQLRARCREIGCTPSDYALSFIRRLPGVTSLVLGAESREQVQEDAAMFGRPPMGDPEYETARRLFAKVPFDRIMEALR
ncbi:MAG: aldo/keto reductase [Clostridiales bacterium]|nr:aldo/keto reductase [Clostridiales bacterium]